MTIDLNQIVNNVHLLAELFVILLIAIVTVRGITSGRLLKFMHKVHSDDLGNVSWMRVASSFVLISSIVLTFHQYNTDKKIDVELVTFLVGLCLGGKAVQKFAENKSTSAKSTDNSTQDKPEQDNTPKSSLDV